MKQHIIRGNRHFKKNDMAGARMEFESAQIDAPEAAFIPYNIGITYYAEGKFDEAKVQFEKALGMTVDPGLKSKIAYNLGHLTFSMGDRPGAIEKFKEALKYDHRDMDAKYNIEYIKAGKTPKNPPQKNNQKDNQQKSGGDKDKQKGKDGESEAEATPEPVQKKEGDLSKEDAERVLNMIQEQEKEKMKQGHPLPMGESKKNPKEGEAGEDW